MRAPPEAGGMRTWMVIPLMIAQVLPVGTAAAGPPAWWGFDVASLDGMGNNRAHPGWGRAGTPYLRLAPPHYADGVGAPVAGPNPRYVSNRVFNDTGQPLFSARGVSQWAA